MTIYVETLKDAVCYKCKHFEIDQQDFFANGEIYERLFRCRNLEMCREISVRIKEKES